MHVGEGADELFAGYPTYVQARDITTRYWAPFRRLPSGLRAAAGYGAAALADLRPGLEIHAEALRRGAQREAHL